MGRAWSRRTFVSQLGTMAAIGGLLPVRNSLAWANGGANAGAQAGIAALKDAAASRGILYGAGETQKHLMADPKLMRAFVAQCAILVPEWELKWDYLRPTPDTYNFAPADWLLNFTQQNNMKMRGHTLVWYQALPKWFDAYINAGNAQQMMLSHISTVVGRYAGKLHSWDVVNEAIDPADRRPDNLRNNSWLKFVGPDYIETAFRAAAQADPSAMLVWNENWMEEETSYGDKKRAAWLQHLGDFLKRNVPIHAIGIQSHLVGDHNNLAGPHFQKFLRDASALGLKILITEMDVQDNNLPADVSTRDGIIGNLYYQYLSTVLNEKAVIAVLTWGLSDAYSWMVGFKPRTDGNPVRPLPLDTNMAPTPAYQAMVRAFNSAPAR